MATMDWEKELAEIVPHIIEVRHDLHRHPELSGQEVRTKQRVIEELTALGNIEIHEFDGSNAVMGVLKNGEGRCIAIRADMDALPVKEETGLPFASENDGVMHACGHDVHVAFALGSASWFSRNLDKWQGTIKWLFEPQEETIGGGKLMTEQGCMKNPTVDCVIGQHVNPSYETGMFFCKSGFVSGSSDEVVLTVRGTNCHGAYPERGVDAILISAQIITALQSLVSRTISPFDPAVLTIGTIKGGTANNIVCGEVHMRGTMRTLSDATRQKLKREIHSVVEGVAQSMGGSAEVQLNPGYGAVYNHDGYYAKIEDCAREILGEDKIVIRSAPSLGVESFCYFVSETPGVYYDIGTGVSTALHTSTFLVDENVFVPGIAMQCASVLALLEES